MIASLKPLAVARPTPPRGRIMTHPGPAPTSLDLQIETQPDDVTCGPTCLHAVYRYWKRPVPLPELIASVPTLPGRGTLAVHLACDALQRGYAATLYTYNLHLFDPTWFPNGGAPEGTQADAAAYLRDRLERQLAYKGGETLAARTEGYLRFLELGGALRFEDLDSTLLRRPLTRGTPIIAGLSATYLYRTAREWGPKDDYDDIRGAPSGHFVVLAGYRPQGRLVEVADPLRDHPLAEGTRYEIGIERVIGAIMLGVLTHDANILLITPRSGGDRRP
ncbi:MAG: hypothetical protein V2I63_07065 [Pseudomonadales bacterium]|jgi:hypothetical protein|nr:hypothetical protein [Pseudomonadales bacterium]